MVYVSLMIYKVYTTFTVYYNGLNEIYASFVFIDKDIKLWSNTTVLINKRNFTWEAIMKFLNWYTVPPTPLTNS